LDNQINEEELKNLKKNTPLEKLTLIQ